MKERHAYREKTELVEFELEMKKAQQVKEWDVLDEKMDVELKISLTESDNKLMIYELQLKEMRSLLQEEFALQRIEDDIERLGNEKRKAEVDFKRGKESTDHSFKKLKIDQLISQTKRDIKRQRVADTCTRRSQKMSRKLALFGEE